MHHAYVGHKMIVDAPTSSRIKNLGSGGGSAGGSAGKPDEADCVSAVMNSFPHD
jgi:hypothetical protein